MKVHEDRWCLKRQFTPISNPEAGQNAEEKKQGWWIFANIHYILGYDKQIKTGFRPPIHPLLFVFCLHFQHMGFLYRNETSR